MKRSFLVSLCSLGLIFSSRGATVWSPFGARSSGGNAYPFVPTPDVAPSVRYQQVYGSADFAREGGPFLITQIRFASGLGSREIDANLPNVRIELSTTSRSPDGLSSVFAENIGADNTVVYAGPLKFYDRGIQRFDIRIPLQTPFRYDPQAGDLLLDVRNFQTVPFSFTGPRFMAGPDVLGDTVSSQWSRDVNSTTAAVVDTLGLETVFDVTIVPEPNTWAMLMMGVVIMIVGAQPQVRGWLAGFRRARGR